MIKNIKLFSRLSLAFLCMGLIPLAVVGGAALYNARQTITAQIFDQMEAVRELKKSQVKQYFATQKDILRAFKENPNTQQAIRSFEAAFRADGENTGGVSWSDVAKAFGPGLKRFVKNTDYLDLYLINGKGDILWSATQGPEVGANLFAGRRRRSPLATAVERARESEVAFADFQPYGPQGEPAAFMAAWIGEPAQENGLGGLAVRLSHQSLNRIMLLRAGMGESGETYLVGRDKRLRCDTYLSPKTHGFLASFRNPEAGSVDTKTVNLALAGQTGEIFSRDYRGVWVLSAYTPVELGAVTWALVAEIDRAEVFSPSYKLVWGIGWIALICVGLVSMFSLGFSRSVVRPVKRLGTALLDISQGEGDLRVRLPVETEDEVGRLSQGFNQFAENLGAMFAQVAENGKKLARAGEQMTALSSKMSKSAESVLDRTGEAAQESKQVNTSMERVAQTAAQADRSVSDIAQMTEEMSSAFARVLEFSQNAHGRMAQMADAGERMSQESHTIATAIEQMTAALNEVAKHTTRASQISQEANQRTHLIDQRMAALGQATGNIRRIGGMIKDIADQTNMLALNAAIEAAGAGEAGKGFAVVAGEIKVLASQSSEATDEIAGQIEAIEGGTDQVLQAISALNHIIEEIAGSNQMIASSSEEQNATAVEISKSVAANVETVRQVAQEVSQASGLMGEITQAMEEVSKTASQVSRNVEELAQGIYEMADSSQKGSQGMAAISQHIRQIRAAADDTAEIAVRTDQAAGELANMAVDLEAMMGRFKL